MKNKSASSLQDAQTKVKGEVTKTADELQATGAPRPIPESVRAELAALAEMSDEDIDYSDIPPTTHEDWANAVRGKFYRPDAQFKSKED